MPIAAQHLAARFARLPDDVVSRCPRPVVDVTPERVHTWLVQIRAVCLEYAAETVDRAVALARRGDLRAAMRLRAEAAGVLRFARELGDFMGLALYDASDECRACGAHLAEPHSPTCPLSQD